MSHRAGFLSGKLSQRTGILGLRLWEILAFGVGALTALILFLLLLRLNAMLARNKPSKKKQLSSTDSINVSIIPTVSKDIKEVVSHTEANTDHKAHELPLYKLPWPVAERRHSLSAVEYMLDDIEKEVVTFNFAYGGDTQVHSVRHPKPALAAVEKVSSVEEYVTATTIRVPQSQIRSMLEDDGATVALASTEVPRGSCADYRQGSIRMNRSRSSEWSGWGEWYSVEELEKATSQFAESNIVGKGGYGVVYRGLLPDASVIAVKHLLNVSRGQAEKEFRVEVEAIGRVRHKNLVGLLGYCADGPHRMLVYEYVDNGNLEQRLHGPLAASKPIPWNVRMNILLGTAKGLAYLHEDLEPKVVHRDVKSSNILLDSHWNAKVSDFGLAKLLGAGMSHVTTRVMGTFGYVAPEYASTGLLTESSDVYSFGVLMMEIITGRDPVDHSRPMVEMNLVEWTKRMVGAKRWEEVLDPRLSEKPSGRALKKALLVALKCVDPDALHRPRMGHVVYMLEADDHTFHHVCKNRRPHGLGGHLN